MLRKGRKENCSVLLQFSLLPLWTAGAEAETWTLLMLAGGTHKEVMIWKYNLPGKWTGLLLHVVGGEYFGQIQLLLALSETPQTDIEESTTQLIPPLALLPL